MKWQWLGSKLALALIRRDLHYHHKMIHPRIQIKLLLKTIVNLMHALSVEILIVGPVEKDLVFS